MGVKQFPKLNIFTPCFQNKPISQATNKQILFPIMFQMLVSIYIALNHESAAEDLVNQ